MVVAVRAVSAMNATRVLAGTSGGGRGAVPVSCRNLQNSKTDMVDEMSCTCACSLQIVGVVITAAIVHHSDCKEHNNRQDSGEHQ